MGMAVAALGSLAGGAAANAIMGTPSTPGPDTSVPGVSKAVIQQGSKGSPEKSIAQVDPTEAINYFKQAGIDQTNALQTGLQFYNTAMNEAVKSINDAYTKSNATLTPAASAATSAINEQLRMLGISPISPSASYSQQVNALGSQYSGLSQALQNAESISDPAARAAAKQNIMNQFQQSQTTVQNNVQQQIAALKGPMSFADYVNSVYDPNQHIGYISRGSKQTAPISALNSTGTGFQPGVLSPSEQANIQAGYQAQVDAYNKQVQDIKNKYAADQSAAIVSNQDLQNIANQFNQNYDVNYNPNAYTGQQVTDKITSTPGYQFTVDQGTKAINRQNAATGNLLSGNTLASVSNYGQQTALGYYNTYMQNLANISTQGSGALSQLANNQANQGNALSQLYTLGGNAALQTYGNIGAAKANSSNNVGNALLSTAQYNASAQNNAINNINAQNNALAQQGIASGPGYLNAQNNANAFNYGVFQNQQGGQTIANAAANAGQNLVM